MTVRCVAARAGENSAILVIDAGVDRISVWLQATIISPADFESPKLNAAGAVQSNHSCCRA